MRLQPRFQGRPLKNFAKNFERQLVWIDPFIFSILRIWEKFFEEIPVGQLQIMRR